MSEPAASDAAPVTNVVDDGAQPAPPAPSPPAEAPTTVAQPETDVSTHTEPNTSAPSAPSPVIDHVQLYEEVKGKPCRVINIDKLYEATEHKLRTKSDIIDRELQRVLDAKTLEEIHLALEDAGRNLNQLQVFNRIDMLVSEEPEDDPEACTVMMDLGEKNWYKVHAATYFQGGESTFETGVTLRNLTGHAEQVRVSGEYGTENSSQFSLEFEKPRLLGLPITLESRVHQYMKNYEKTSSFTEQLRGGLLALKSTDGMHTLQYEAGWRTLADPTTHASRAVLAQTGDYLKSALKYCLFLDRRDTPAHPTQGWAFKSTSEVAGLWPDANLRFGKQQLDVQVVQRIADQVTLSLTGTAGVLLPWGPDFLSSPTCIADRFFLGGPSTLRGFKFKGVGPTDLRRRGRTETELGSSASDGSDASAELNSKRDALGGDLYASVLAAVNFPIPHKAFQALKVHGHVFVNGGNNVQLAGTGAPWRERVRDFGATFRWSAGAGIVLPTWFGRFEVNYVHVLSHQQHDRFKQGIQMGFASSIFL